MADQTPVHAADQAGGEGRQPQTHTSAVEGETATAGGQQVDGTPDQLEEGDLDGVSAGMPDYELPAFLLHSEPASVPEFPPRMPPL